MNRIDLLIAWMDGDETTLYLVEKVSESEKDWVMGYNNRYMNTVNSDEETNTQIRRIYRRYCREENKVSFPFTLVAGTYGVQLGCDLLTVM